MKILITGIKGFIGRHLFGQLIKEGHEIHGITREEERIVPTGTEAWPGPALRGAASLRSCDVRDGRMVEEVLAKIQPELIFHLAGFASARRAKEFQLECWDVNVRGTINVLDAASRRCSGATVVLAGTAMQYGIVGASNMPISETQPILPREAYGASKAAAELAGMQWASNTLKVVLLRIFNIMGPEQDPIYVCSDLARQVARIEKKKQNPVIATGDLTITRDFTDVRDAATALRMAPESCESGIPYNICTGEAVSIGQFLETLRSLADTSFDVVRDPEKIRKIDIPDLRGDPTRFMKLTGWRPKIAFRESIKNILDSWRQVVGEGK